jgi:transposase
VFIENTGDPMMELKDCAAFVGIDWGDEEHAVCLVDTSGQKLDKTTLDQDAGAIDQWVADLQARFPNQKIAVCLEQKRGALIYALMKFDCLVLVPINPKQLARFREAFVTSGAKDDPTDAWDLAELLFKHGDRLRIWEPEEEDVRKLRLLAEDRRNFVDERTKLTNRLKSRLKQHFPVALKVSGSCIYSEMACEFLLRYPTLEKLQAASDDELRDFFREQHCYRHDVIGDRIDTIRQAKALTTDQPIIESNVTVVHTLVKQIQILNKAIDDYDGDLAALMRSHQDAEIFKSLPGAGAAMAPRLAAVMGTDRDRFSTASDVQSFSGVAPVTRQSGKSRVVHRRWACNHFILQTFHEFAAHSINHSVWAKGYYKMMKQRGSKHQAAVRALAFKWIRIIFRCWKTKTPYDELTYISSLIKNNSPVLKYMATPSN